MPRARTLKREPWPDIRGRFEVTIRRFQAPDTAVPAFPLWPYAFAAYLESCSLDYVDYVDRLTHAESAVAVIAAEEALGENLLNDTQRTLTLMWSPFGATFADGGALAPWA